MLSAKELSSSLNDKNPEDGWPGLHRYSKNKGRTVDSKSQLC